MPSTRLGVGAAAQCVQLAVTDAIHGVASPTINLTSPDGAWKIRVPRSAFSNMHTEAGDTIVVSLTLVKVTVEEVPDELLKPQLIVPGRPN